MSKHDRQTICLLIVIVILTILGIYFGSRW